MEKAVTTDIKPSYPELTIIIPCYNEESVLPLLFDRLTSLPKHVDAEIKYLFIDDGSKDQTWNLLASYSDENPSAAAIKLSRNFGHQTAVSAGMANIKSGLVGIMDADLQDPPEFFQDMIQAWRNGADVVYAIRKNRKENFILKIAYWFFYRLLKKMANIEIALDSGDFALMDEKVVEWMNTMPEHNRFVRGIRGWVGFNQVGIEYNREARAAGKPKYTLSKLISLAMDGLISFSSLPLKLSGWIGFLAALFGFIVLLYELIKFYFGSAPSGWASTFAAIVFFGGVQLFMLGIIGQYLGRIFDEVKQRPIYVSQTASGWLKDQNLIQPGKKMPH